MPRAPLGVTVLCVEALLTCEATVLCVEALLTCERPHPHLRYSPRLHAVCETQGPLDGKGCECPQPCNETSPAAEAEVAASVALPNLLAKVP